MGSDQDGGLVARDRSSLSPDEAILLAAMMCFLEKGYHGTTVKEIARAAGLSVPGLYHHYPSKMSMLEELLVNTMDDLNSRTFNAIEAAGEDPVEKFTAAVEAHVRFHCERIEESFLGNSELRSLNPEFHQRVLAKRDRQQAYFNNALEEGIDAGVFMADWPRERARAIASMCTAVATWYHRDGPMTPDEVVVVYRDLALNLVGYPASSA